MEDLEITLINYIPFSGNGIHKFVYTPTKPIQLIIGSNGSGKSSLKRQLSPLPGEASDFSKGGKKIVRMGAYELISDFTKGGSGEHFFIKDGINLNVGKTLSVQKVMVKEEFGITKEIHSLLIGEKGYVFSEMSPAKRKEWLTLLSPSSFDYIMDVFQYSSTILRDKMGAIKHIAGKLNSVIQQDGDEDETSESVRANVVMLEQFLTENRMFQEAILNTIPNKKTSHNKLELLHLIDDTSSKVIRNLKGPLVDTMIGLDIDNLSGAVGNNNALISVSQREIESITDRIQQLEIYIANAKVINESGNASELAAEIQALKDQLPECLVGINPFPLQMSFVATRAAILDASGGIQYSDEFSRENVQRLKTLLNDTTQRRGAVITAIDQDAYKLQRLQRAISIACKKCGYYECADSGHADTEASISVRIENNDAISKQLQSELDDINEQLGATELWGRYTASLRAIKEANPDINQFFWSDFIAKNIFKGSYDIIRSYLDDRSSKLDIAVKLYHLEQKRAEIAKATLVTGSYSGMSYDDAVAMLDNTCALRMEQYSVIDTLRNKNRLINELIGLMERNDGLLNDLIDNLYSELRDIVRNEMNEAIGRIEKAIGYQYSRLSELEGRRKLIEELTAQMDELKSDIRAYEVLTKKLSPNTGLIAKLLTSSINGVIGNMNLIIESVWTYSLIINPCNIEDGKLDYKFPMSVKNNPIPVKDIGLGSSGQADIIDFAFRTVAYRALGIKSYPLFLDEFGTSFDEQHKFNTTELIKMLSQSGMHPYIFFISHYYGQHGGLPNNETLVMDDANVSVPAVYNTHVVMS